MVAMHEIRKNFPLDQVAVGDVMPENCHEFAYPGAHSDVGGGYAPGGLGLAIGDSPEDGDTRKLSQIPLNHMFECAVAAGTPMSKRTAVTKSK
ncbi:phospholipase effector Tle1 domain-containing protein, partial [Pseudomonas viridiflava]|uniref:phospholipase effector Tle1 domain-containing protein n=1 Tax=Pseudomonas viridiflava TaxID=33069 RepID=UPI0019D2631D